MKTVPPTTTIAVAMCSQREATLRISTESIADQPPRACRPKQKALNTTALGTNLKTAGVKPAAR